MKFANLFFFHSITNAQLIDEIMSVKAKKIHASLCLIIQPSKHFILLIVKPFIPQNLCQSVGHLHGKKLNFIHETYGHILHGQ